ncbi:hypothetical protein [Lentzea sp. NPDC059081]|uniref:hypothetical protein n=1 Tax=Lentzea sp. NPDC059081 TaxID=3346719 RepID=UPI0036A5A44C
MSDYDQVMPLVQAHVEKFGRALAVVRETHVGHPVEQVREALLEACAAEGVDVGAEVVEDAARLISEGK